MDLNKFNDDELRTELIRREHLRLAAMRPQLLEKPDFTKLINTCEEYVNDLMNGESVEDYHSRVFEATMIALYGPKVFDKINALDK